MNSLAGRCFCVSFARPEQVGMAHQIGQSVMLDNGAFSAWRRGHEPVWPKFYEWCDGWLDHPTSWAVIPDVIDGGSQLQDALVREWPHGHRGAPVWHMDEPMRRLLQLADSWPRVCIGSTAEYAVLGTDAWHRRMTEAFESLEQRHGRRLPWIHMLRGMQTVEWGYPFGSVDSTDVAQNHARKQRIGGPMVAGMPIHHADETSAARKAAAWDAAQCPPSRRPRAVQLELASGGV